MRRILSFECEGVTLAATLDEAPGTTGLLVVSGGNEIRIGAHRGMAKLAADVAAAGYPVFRFDRRGIGDSEGENGGFRSSGPDIREALAAFRLECPTVTHVVAFGNCDAATALLLHEPNIVWLVLANPWVIDQPEELPPAAAIRAHYWRRLRDPTAWKALLTGRLNLGSAAKGLKKIATAGPTSATLADEVGGKLARRITRTTLLLALRDNTAIAFISALKRPSYENVRTYQDWDIHHLDSSSHSFATDVDYQTLSTAIISAIHEASET